MLWGRQRETAEIERLVAGARSGRSEALVLRGEPGIGKSAPLRHAVDVAGTARVLRGTGIESESELPFAGLHPLPHPYLARADTLPGRQAAAQRAALELGPGADGDRLLVSADGDRLLVSADDDRSLPGADGDRFLVSADGDRFLVGLAVLTLLADLAEGGPGAATSSDTMTGTPGRNIEPHQKYSSSTPPTTGPSAVPAEKHAIQTPIAIPRCLGSPNIVPISDSVDGISVAPAIPSRARAAMSISAPVEYAARIEATPNAAAPTISRRPRPIRSPSAPIVTRNPALMNT